MIIEGLTNTTLVDIEKLDRLALTRMKFKVGDRLKYKHGEDVGTVIHREILTRPYRQDPEPTDSYFILLDNLPDEPLHINAYTVHSDWEMDEKHIRNLKLQQILGSKLNLTVDKFSYIGLSDKYIDRNETYQTIQRSNSLS